MAFLKRIEKKRIEKKRASDDRMGGQQVTMVEQRTEGWKHSGTLGLCLVTSEDGVSAFVLSAFFTDILPAVKARQALEVLLE